MRYRSLYSHIGRTHIRTESFLDNINFPQNNNYEARTCPLHVCVTSVTLWPIVDFCPKAGQTETVMSLNESNFFSPTCPLMLRFTNVLKCILTQLIENSCICKHVSNSQHFPSLLFLSQIFSTAHRFYYGRPHEDNFYLVAELLFLPINFFVLWALLLLLRHAKKPLPIATDVRT